MSLLDQLRNVGQQMGLLRVVAANPQGEAPAAVTPRKLTTRTITLKDLSAEVEAQEIKALAHGPTHALIDVEQVIAAAGVRTDASAWSMPKLQELLQSDALKGKDRKQIQAAILTQLAADKATVEDIVKDAIARDQAIDTYDAMAHEKLRETTEIRQRRLAELEDEMRTLSDEARRDEQYFADWHRKKVQYETAMAAAINYLLDKPVVTVEEQLPDAKQRPAK